MAGLPVGKMAQVALVNLSGFVLVPKYGNGMLRFIARG